ncbi:MAG: RNA-binding cell elongation regulator Jag/EloR [bacterium]|nr:RNA-binding cell elongation regulator Jag/EloR [bacterium]
MRILEQEGRTADEAVESALKKLGVSREKVKVEILDKGNKGLFGLVGSKPAKIKVFIKDDPSHIAYQITNRILGLMGIKAEIDIKEDNDEIHLEIKTEDPGILIGKRGKTLNSLQFIVNLLVNKVCRARRKIILDTERYRDRRQKTLEDLAKRLADKVKETKKEIVLEPMNSHERHIIHTALQEDSLVTTRSRGEGEYRRVTIYLKGQGDEG